jgi:hypothetical protein
MTEDQRIWQVWADMLHRWGVKELAAQLLDSFGPLTILGAQVLYLCQPLLSPGGPEEHIKSLASMLEDSTKKQAFVSLLKEGKPN